MIRTITWAVVGVLCLFFFVAAFDNVTGNKFSFLGNLKNIIGRYTGVSYVLGLFKMSF